MYKYDYTFYNADDGLLFALNHSGDPSVIGDDYYFTYTAMMSSLRSEASLASTGSMHASDYSLYPMAVRYFDPLNNLYVIERPPFEIDVDFSIAKSYGQRKSPRYLSTTKIWIPWTVSVISFSSTVQSNILSFNFSIYFNNKPLTSLDEHLVSCYLPNSDYSGRICMGQDALPVNQMIASNPKDIASTYNTAFNSYFAGWNSDLIPDFYLTPYIKNLITNKISKIKGSPKHYRDFVPFLPYNTSFHGTHGKYLSSVLYTVSNMSLEETFQYIESCKEKYNTNPNSHKKTILRDRIKPYITPDPYSYNSIDDLNDSNYFKYITFLFRKTQPIYSRITVTISDLKKNSHLIPHHFIDNPYIVYKIYSLLHTQFSSETPTFIPNNIHFSISEVVQYNKEHTNLAIKDSEQNVIVSS